MLVKELESRFEVLGEISNTFSSQDWATPSQQERGRVRDEMQVCSSWRGSSCGRAIRHEGRLINPSTIKRTGYEMLRGIYEIGTGVCLKQ